MKEADILRALQNAAKQAVAGSLRPLIPIKFLQGTWQQPEDGVYWELVRIDNNVDNATWGDERQFRGLFRLLLHWTAAQTGAYIPLEIAQSVADHFTKGRFFDRVKVTDVPNVSGPIENPPDVMYAIGVRYETFSA